MKISQKPMIVALTWSDGSGRRESNSHDPAWEAAGRLAANRLLARDGS